MMQIETLAEARAAYDAGQISLAELSEFATAFANSGPGPDSSADPPGLGTRTDPPTEPNQGSRPTPSTPDTESSGMMAGMDTQTLALLGGAAVVAIAVLGGGQ